MFSLVEMAFVSAIVACLSGGIAGEVVRIKGGTEQQFYDAQRKWFWIGAAVGAVAYATAWATYSLWLIMFGGGTAASTTVNESTSLYRCVEQAELKAIDLTSSFQACAETPTGAPGKFFWGSLQEAQAFQTSYFYKFGEVSTEIVKTTINSSTPVWRFGSIVDGVGDPFFVEMTYLTSEIIKVGGGG